MNLPSRDIPKHVAIIMDGNGRWAEQRGLARLAGHTEGAKSVEAAVKICQDVGIEYLTLYAFSTENWRRTKEEVTGLMRLLNNFLRSNLKQLHQQDIRLRAMGRLDDLPSATRTSLLNAIEKTAAHQKGQLILALSYGSRNEIVRAARELARQAAAGTLKPQEIDSELFAANLYLPDIPDPDLLIRTSGELRLSNFLLWQLSYAELYFTDVLWPDFRENEFKKALLAYSRRQRRFGGRPR